VTLDRQTAADWMGRVAWWLSPLWERLLTDVLASPKLFVDDTYPSSRVHSRYERRLADLPWQGRPVILRLQARRFLCREAGCPKRTFAERLPGIAQPSARRSERLVDIQRHIALRHARYAGVRRLADAGATISAIARNCALDRKTVRAWLRVGGPGTWARPPSGVGILAPDLEHLEHRWAEGQRNATALWREIGGQGFTGGRSTVRAWATSRRRTSPDAGPSKADTWFLRRHHLATDSKRWKGRPPHQLTASETNPPRGFSITVAPFAGGPRWR
ncbi:transposase family protein, partial [Azospirillum brasilense]